MDDFTHGRFIDLDRTLNEPPPETRKKQGPCFGAGVRGARPRLLGLETLWAINTITTPGTNETQFTPKPVATMYEIAATVTTAVPTELKLTGN